MGQEIDRIEPAKDLQTIFFGGGTPTVLPDSLLSPLLGRIRDLCALPPREWTCEANPETVTPERARLLSQAGVNRVSLGAQSFQLETLRSLGRDHAPRDVFRALDVLREEGLDNLSLDLIFAAPGQTRAQLDRDLDVLLDLDLPHVSAYCLTYESGTPLTQQWQQGRVAKASEDTELLLYRRIQRRLGEAGYQQYEISNYARPGFECQHNQVYWRAESYYGLGLGAGSYEHGVRRTNTRNLHEYLGPWPEPHRPPHESEELDRPARAREQVVLGLRTAEGVALPRLNDETGHTLGDLYEPGTLERFQELGFLLRDETSMRLTLRGFEVADSILSELV